MTRTWFVLLLGGAAPLSCIGDLGGKVEDVGQQVTTALDQAINAIDAQSNNWQAVLTELVSELPAEVQSTVTNEVTSLMQRGIAATGAEIRCDTDFFANRMKQGLLSIKLAFLGGTPLPVEPQLCSVVPLAVDLNLEPERRNKIELYGYDFDQTQIQVAMETSAGETDVTRFLDQPTHYHLTLNLGSGGVQIPADARRFALRWGGRTISTIGVLQPNPNVCESQIKEIAVGPVGLMPRRTRGDAEYSGNGPAVYASVKLQNRGTGVDAEVYLRAAETESDWSTAEEAKVFPLFNADPGWTVHSIVSPTTASHSYTDVNHDNDEFVGNGPVQKWIFVGDGSGDDIGVRTRVDLYLNNLRVELKQSQDCVPTSTLRVLDAAKLLAPATKEALKTRFPTLITPDLRIAPELIVTPPNP